MQRRCCKAVRARSASQPKEGELVPPTSQAPAPRTWCKPTEIRSPWVALSIMEFKVCASHRFAPSKRDAASSRTLSRNCVSAAVTSGSWVSLNSDQRLLQREDVLPHEARKAAGEQGLSHRNRLS